MKQRKIRNMHKCKEGFSLVEIIIVIAIMAILVGVIALAVIPNIARSHESKDLTKLDNIASSVNVAIANNRVSESGGFEYGVRPSDGTADQIVYDAVIAELGSDIHMESSAADGHSINVSWTIVDDSAAHVIVQLGDGTVPCSFTKGTPGNSDGYRYFIIQ